MSSETRDRIVQAATELLAEGGRESVTTRAVSARAGVQAPAIYRIFGDMRGLLDAVAEHAFAAYVGPKVTRQQSDDPIEDLRRGWDLHLDFALANPALYVLMTEPRPQNPSVAAEAGIAYLRALVERIAATGRLAVPVERAVRLIHACGSGATLSVLSDPARDRTVSNAAREATIATITTDSPAVTEAGPAAAAMALHALLPQVEELSSAEKALLADWLDRLASSDRRAR